MKNPSRVLNVLAKLFTWYYIFYFAALGVAVYFAGKMIHLVLTEPIFENQKDFILNTLFPNTSAVVIQGVLLLMLPAGVFLGVSLFRILVRFVQAQKKGLSLAEQGVILSKAPRLLVMLFLLGAARKVLGTFLPTAYLEMGQHSAKTLPAWAVYIDLLTPNVTSSFNLILAVLIHIYVKNLLETDALKKEAELVV